METEIDSPKVVHLQLCLMAKHSVFRYLFININTCTDMGEIARDAFPAADNFATC